MRQLKHLILQNKDYITFALSIAIILPTILENKDSQSLSSIALKGIPVVHSSMNHSANIRISYSF